MVKPLVFKGHKQSKKRKASHADDENGQGSAISETQEDDSWVTAEAATDLAGPVIIVLPSTKSTCVACDANGKIFASELENMVESDPATAEPHDVRQVWVANRVAGTQEISFKGHHGRCISLFNPPSPRIGSGCLYSNFTEQHRSRYLSCDRIGVLSANRDAISPEESFLCIPSTETPGTFSIQTVRDNFLTIADETKLCEIRGDAESISFNTTLRLRIQARFKPKHKANKEQKVRERISRRELEEAVGRRLEDDEVRQLKKARVQGGYHEAVLDVRVKGKHDKYS